VKIPLDELYCGSINSNKLFSYAMLYEHLFSADMDKFRLQGAYNNINYILIGGIIEALTGSTYENAVSKIMCQEGMFNTEFVSSCTSHEDDFGNAVAMSPFLFPAFGACGGLDDIIDFGRLFLSSDKIIARSILSQKIVFMEKYRRGSAMIYGNSGAWFFKTGNQGTLYFHNGFSPRYSNVIAVIPESNLGIYVAVEQHKSYVPEMLMNILAMYYQDLHYDSKGTIKQYDKLNRISEMRSLWGAKKTTNSFTLANLEGQYHSHILGDFSVVSHSGVFYINIFDLRYEVKEKNHVVFFYFFYLGIFVGISALDDNHIVLTNLSQSIDYVCQKKQ